MNQRASAVFYPVKQGKKTKFYKRITRLVIISIIINLLLFLLYAFPFIKAQLHKFKSSFADKKTITAPDSVGNPAAFNFNHPPYLYAGHSFPKDSTGLMLSREMHLAKLLSKMEPVTQTHLKVIDSIYQVKEGETLYAIAKMFGVSVASIKENNTIPATGIRPGMPLKIMIVTTPVGYYGIDVSSWQNSINWKSVHNDTLPSPLKFYIIKATQGKDITDFYFRHNWENAAGTNACIGAYHFYVADEDPILQAKNYIKNVPLTKGNFRPIIDLEYDCSNCNSLSIARPQFIKNLKTFLSYIEAHYNAKPILYTYSSFYTEYLKNNFDGYTYWMASYTEKAPQPMNVFGLPGKALLPEIYMWQFSSSEKIRGIAGNVDVSFLPAENLKAMLLEK